MAFDANKITSPNSTNVIGEWLMAQVDTVLESAIAAPIEKLATALAPIIVVALSLQFLAYAFALMRGHGNMSLTEFFWKAGRVAIIASIATAGGMYQTDISSVMLSLPDDLAGVVAGGQTLAAQIDTLRVDIQEATVVLESKEGNWYPSSKNILVNIYAGCLTLMAAVVGACVTVLTIVAKVGMALVVATGPIFIAALVFDRTERMFDSWVSQALNFVFLALLVGLVFAVFIQLNIAYIGMLIELLTGGGAQLLSLLGGYFLVGIATIAIAFFIPGIAQGLSSGFGAQLGVGAAGRGAMGIIRLQRFLSK